MFNFKIQQQDRFFTFQLCRILGGSKTSKSIIIFGVVLMFRLGWQQSLFH